MKLFIRLTPGTLRPQWGRQYANEFDGGPATLLRWLETQLGLPVAGFHQADRITEYAAAIDALGESVIADSLAADRWATASELLTRRDELMLGGWDESDSESLPHIVRELARAASGRTFVFPGEATRLQKIIEALGSGQTLPPHTCYLFDPAEKWPAQWRVVLDRLDTVVAPQQAPAGPADSALFAAQSVLGGGEVVSINQDQTFRYAHTRSQAAAVEFVVATLSAAPDKLSNTVICCEEDDLASSLDACLNRTGLATTGASTWARAHPVLQILPLSVALCWQPVDPQSLLDFLTLPVSPLPRKAASRLANALTQEPGLGSSSWKSVTAELCSSENDADGKLRERLDAWLSCERTAVGGQIPARNVRERCSLVAQWASGRAKLLSKDDDSNPNLIKALYVAAGQASLLGQLAESQGSALSQPQLARLLEEALGRGVETTSFIEADGGPIRVRSLSEIDGTCDRLIWLGLGTGEANRCRWSTHQLRELRNAGIEIDDGNNSLASLRSAEVRGFSYVKESFMAVLLPQDLDKRWHPLWLAFRTLFSDQDIEHPPVFEDLVAAGNTDSLSPFVFEYQDIGIEQPQVQRPLWDIPGKLFADRESVSATELQDRLGCPLKWTFNYQARLRSSPIAELPGDFQLKGTFCHSIFERVFDGGEKLPTVDEAVAQVLAAFDERLPLDAAPLAQPNKYFERQQLRSEMENATRVFVGTLTSGGYQIAGIEVELSGEAFGKTLNGWIDCLAQRDDGNQAIVDFKYGGRAKYHSLIENGEAVQLATYAYGRSTTDGTFPAVAYLVLSDGLLYTPSGSPIEGDGNRSVIDAPAIQTVWQQFSEAINNADGWRTSDDPVPARPLQEPSDWPDGASILLDEKLKADNVQSVCRYCSYQRLCGLKETN
ncbi:PD-(D/E)XK nuclease family protein [Mariniblastus sp.]|nr:PD-(D/E)XK nuclease family protein [Mariniblastus sp.]